MGCCNSFCQNSVNNTVFDEESLCIDLSFRNSNFLPTQNLVVEHCCRDIDDYYIIENERILGGGLSGSVRVCKSKITGVEFALKTLNINLITKEKLFQIHEEIKILLELDHPNIIRLYEYFVAADQIFLILEMCRGGELFDRLKKQPNEQYSEVVARRYVHTILKAIRYCHLHNIVHRDLKLENFLFETEDEDSELKLIDFGLGQHFQANHTLHRTVGTLYYLAPEVLNHCYDAKCDVWSLGVISYMLLSGIPPFFPSSSTLTPASSVTTYLFPHWNEAVNEDIGIFLSPSADLDVIKKIKEGKWAFHERYFPNVTPEAKSFITQCLIHSPSLRPSSSELLSHPWFHSLPPSYHQLLPLSLSPFTTKSRVPLPLPPPPPPTPRSFCFSPTRPPLTNLSNHPSCSPPLLLPQPSTSYSSSPPPPLSTSTLFSLLNQLGIQKLKNKSSSSSSSSLSLSSSKTIHPPKHHPTSQNKGKGNHQERKRAKERREEGGGASSPSFSSFFTSTPLPFTSTSDSIQLNIFSTSSSSSSSSSASSHSPISILTTGEPHHLEETEEEKSNSKHSLRPQLNLMAIFQTGEGLEGVMIEEEEGKEREGKEGTHSPLFRTSPLLVSSSHALSHSPPPPHFPIIIPTSDSKQNTLQIPFLFPNPINPSLPLPLPLIIALLFIILSHP